MLGYLVVGLVLVVGVPADDCNPKSCPGSGEELLPIPSDCSRYVSCLNGHGKIRNCSEGLRFHKSLRICVRSNKAECDSCDGSSEEENAWRHFTIRKKLPQIQSVLDNLHRTSNISQRCLQNSVTKVKCPEDIDDDRLMPHPDDCRLFYVCVTIGKDPVCRDCPPNLHFNPIKKVCDHPESAGCRSFFDDYSTLVRPIPITKPDLSKPTVKSIFHKLNHVKGLERCEKQKNTGLADLRPDPKNCSKYHVCDWGFLIPMSCPEGLHFSTVFKVCDLPQNARCQLENATKTNEILQSHVLTEPAQPRTGLVQCETHNGVFADLRPDPKNCSTYYVCDWGSLISMRCPDGLHFNAILKVCDWPHNAKCQLDNATQTNNVTQSPILIEPDQPWDNATQTNNVTQSPILIEPDQPWDNATQINNVTQSPILIEPDQPRENVTQCVEGNGTYTDLRPDPKSCSKYYVCDRGQLFPMKCPRGFHFNAVLKMCNSPYKAKCPLFNPSSNMGSSSEEQDSSESSEGSREWRKPSKK